MSICFYDGEHERFYCEKQEIACMEGRRADSYFNSFLYLCGLCSDTRTHFQNIFDWDEWCICPEALSQGWQTGTSRKVIRLAFNLWNGYGAEQPEDEHTSALFLPDELFCCAFQPYFFEAIRLRFPEYAGIEVKK